MIYVVTPTYNRARLLPRLYEALRKQTNKNFIWFVVDDGSIDNTSEVVAEFNTSDFEIRYEKKANGGKHTALNLAISELNPLDLVFIVDSDDYPVENAIERIYEVSSRYKKEESNKTLCGYSFLRKHADGSSFVQALPSHEFVSSYVEFRINQGYIGDMAEIWYAYALKEFPFPEYPGERYMPEDGVWIPMGLKYQLVFIDEAIYVSDYLEDGLTNNWRTLKIKSPNCCAYRCKQFTRKEMKWKYRVKGEVGRIVYSKFANKKFLSIVKDSNLSWLCILVYLPSCILKGIYSVTRK